MVTARYPPLIGGTEAHVADVSRGLVALDHRVTVLTLGPDVGRTHETNEDGVDVVRVPARRVWSDVYYSRELTRQIGRRRPDLVHVQGYHTLVAPLAMWTARRRRIPYVVTFHSGGHDSRFRRAVRPLQRRALRPLMADAAQLVAVSVHERQVFERSLRVAPWSIAVIPTGVDPAFTTTEHVDELGPLIVTVGRLARYKGHQYVIQALPHVRARVPDARLLVLGDGHDRQQLEALAVRLGVGDSVEFDYVPANARDQLARRLSHARVIAFMSSYESQGIAGYEAVAVGARVVIARGTALDELAPYPGVELIDREDVDELVEVLVRQLQAPRLPRRPDVPSTMVTSERLAALYRSALI
jgi:glycosyltransferase involved in cell wall biosynthesis